jgi:hypothetical protein
VNSAPDSTQPEAITQLKQAIQAKIVPHVTRQITCLTEAQRITLLKPALTQLALEDPSSVQWFIRHIMTQETRDQLKQGILSATIDYLQEQGFTEGKDFTYTENQLILSRQALPYAAADDDPLGQVLVAEFCQLQE